VILSGTLDDGSVGLYAIRRVGGRTLVQDPDEALFPEMPTNAIRYAQPDKVLPTVDLAHEVNRLVMEEEANPATFRPSAPGMDDTKTPFGPG
jgi:two-component system chemotaxis response regulator CheB